jgi:taurine dioxygenase
MTLEITPSGQACDAALKGLDLNLPRSRKVIARIRRAWHAHHVLAFPGQAMSDDDLERFSRYFGRFGVGPFIASIDGR